MNLSYWIYESVRIKLFPDKDNNFYWLINTIIVRTDKHPYKNDQKCMLLISSFFFLRKEKQKIQKSINLLINWMLLIVIQLFSKRNCISRELAVMAVKLDTRITLSMVCGKSLYVGRIKFLGVNFAQLLL